MSQKRANELDGGGCGAPPMERNRYFTGKYMTARDFAGEQAYFLNRQRLHNRLFHGWGIVCGLRVLEHPKDECRENWVVVKAGVAVDCCGREIFLHKDTAIEVPLDELPLPDEEGEDGGEAEAQGGQGDDGQEGGEARLQMFAGRSGRRRRRRGGRHRCEEESEEYGWLGGDPDADWPDNGLLVCLRYDEEEIEPVPALYAEGRCDPSHHEPNRIREVARLEFRRLDEMGPGCWRMPNGSWHSPCRDDCDEPLPGPGNVCLDPYCPCNGCVPLALLVRRDDGGPGEPIFDIDLRGRRHLPTPQHYLTHIVATNWPHGGEVSLQQLRHDMDGKLKIRFDRKVLPADGIATGVSQRTFIAEFGGITRHLEFLPSPEDDDPRLEDDGCTAVYPIASEYLRGRDNIGDTFVYVTLKCDFILDCHELPVDGNHLRGRLPSGNGRPGGEFVSWFRVVHGHGFEEE